MSTLKNQQVAHGPFKTARVGGFDTISCTRDELAQIMVADALKCRAAPKENLPKLIFSSNGQGIALAASDERFRRAMECADIVHADGMPVVLFSKFTRNPMPERIATTDFFHNAAKEAVAHNLKFFILGATKRQNEEAVKAISRLYPDLRVVGNRDGYFSAEEDETVCREIVESGADVLWVALGKPRQEFWSVENRERLRGVAWIKTCGGLYAFLSGEDSRAPQIMQKFALEWLYRLVKDPGRLAKRYLLTNPVALFHLLTKSRY